MSSFVGIVRWTDNRRLDHRDGGRFQAAVQLPGHGRPAFLSSPPLHAAFCQRIVTPEDRWESQPVVAGDLVSLFDGRIDDRAALADRLGLPLAGMTDGALAAAAFRRWGADAPREVLGEFAWAMWDGAERRLALACDTSVSRTLYACRGSGFVAFATGLGALFTLPEVPREVDDEGLAELIVQNPGQGERTVYRDVVRVMGGTTLVIDRDGARRFPNWEPRPVAVPRAPEDVAEAAREVFGRALQDRLRTIGSNVVALSGGLDSSIIAAAAAQRRAPDPVHGIVLVPLAGVPLHVRPGMVPDNLPQVAALARAHPNLRVSFIEPPVDPIDADPTALFVKTGLPVGLTTNLGWLLAAWRAAHAAGARVILTGDDGEMSLTHNGSLRAVVRQGEFGHALGEAWRISRRQGGGLLRLLDGAFLNGSLSWLRDRQRRSWTGNWRRHSPINPELAEATRMRERLLAEGFPAGRQHQSPGYAELVERCLRWQSPAAESAAALRQLADLDHTTPFADRRLLEFCLSLPESMFVRDGWTRWLARAPFRGLLPPEVREYSVKGAQNPEWFHRLTVHRGALHEQLERIETSPLAKRALDIPRLKALLDRWPASAEEAAAGPDYRTVLVHGLHVGAFLRWLDPGNGG